MSSVVPIAAAQAAWPEHPEPKQHLGDGAQHTALGGWIKDPTSRDKTWL